MQGINLNPLAGHEKYEKVGVLGNGSFGFVILARNKLTGKTAAIKVLWRTSMDKYVEAEILNHSKLRHAHVIQFQEVFLTSDNICIAMEHATEGSLYHFVQRQGRLDEGAARWFFQQLMLGIDYCHKRGVANRDIKLENTLLQAVSGLPLPLVKICDFGYSKSDTMSVAKSKVGTLSYMAPEILVNRNGKYDGKVADIWSCGVMLYVMLYGRYPFESPPGAKVSKGVEILQLVGMMVDMKYTIPEDVEVSSEGRDLLQRMLLPDPATRIQLEQIMVHPWFTTNLPPEAATLNDSYLRAPFPAGHQQPDEIRQLLEGAKQQTAANASVPMANIMTAPPEDDGYDASFQNAIREEVKTYGESSSINSHSGNMQTE
ncbi:hypothetical protein CEUSTIGMA_g3910.t1 [Chlamydomonas eustigma]|uniref:Protein kinase domain-containing protein n=1 Tax=Chlamydomonas eustigma TaxID=1157962 RepID=A0A250X092_9CHLO|nr:hypothetical protein CEUSTIGMA_g3910.t1 [Chlamydomonas eustigma]|eukprot:GAX76465.1 hypothetical protein CEUSTIGMA_g3910.t1 [Chlamydomonas eustigma]